MKCPKCGHSHKAKYGSSCGGCKYHFAFIPKVAPKMTDGRFLALIKKASADDTRYFTLNQLYFHYVKRQAPGMGCLVGQIIVSCAAGVVAWVFISSLGLVTAAIAAVVAFALMYLFGGMLKKINKPITVEKFDEKIVKIWTGQHGAIQKLILKPTLAQPPGAAKYPDVFDYGVERLVIVQQDILVDLLVLNGWHTENRALVISEKGYPNYMVPQAQKYLQENPELAVFILHDATPEGEQMTAWLARNKLFPLGGRGIVDLGFSMQDTQSIKVLRRFPRHRRDGGLTADTLPYSSLALGLTAAVTMGMSFQMVLEKIAHNAALQATYEGFG